jgi:threonine dehydratase
MLEDLAAAKRPREMLVTPLHYSAALSKALHCELYLKCEHLQTTGSFKYRGAATKLRILGAQAANGVITASTGNHGQAVALAGRLAGVDVTVYAGVNASPTKLDAIRAYGAKLVLLDDSSLAIELQARADAQAQGKPYVAPYNDAEVIAGQGTIGVELLEQAPPLDFVFIAVGGGGLISGVGAFLKSKHPGTSIIGCWPEIAPSLKVALDAGHIVDVDEGDTISDGTAGGIEPGSITLDICRQVIDQTVLVSETAIKRAMRDIASAERWMVEGAAGVAFAAAQKMRSRIEGKNVAVVLCGRNIALDKFIAAVAP